MSGNQRKANDTRWQDVLEVDNALALLSRLAERLRVVQGHALHADPIHPEPSLDRIHAEASLALRELATLRAALAELNEEIIRDISTSEIRLVKRSG